MVVAVLLMIEAVKRIQHPEPIEANIVIWLALLGIAFNGYSVLLLKKNSKDNMNIRSAYLHLFSDMLASIAVLLGGVLIKYFDVYLVDSLLTLGIGIYLIVMGFGLLNSSFKVLMLYTPEDIEIEEIVKEVESIDKVMNMHHVHAWQLNEHEMHLEAHIDFDTDIKLSEFDEILKQIEIRLRSKFNINHVNIQPEFGKCDDKDLIVQD
jgi:cobalt-zinc-cadmium efflux system protein